jgi:hypothetical protein
MFNMGSIGQQHIARRRPVNAGKKAKKRGFSSAV